MYAIGKKIEDISFEMYHKGDIKKSSLSEYKGKWLILFFYPADFTFICPTELKDLCRMYDKFVKLGAEVISISRDTAFTHKAWLESDDELSSIKYPMASDLKGSLTRYFNVFESEDALSLRATYIIDPEGVVKSSEVNDNSIGRNVEETYRKLTAAIFVSKNNGKVCPANWNINKESLKLPNLTILKDQ